MDIIKWLQKWYSSNCDGYWEHLYGIKIENIDNPGWSVEIDLTDTILEDKVFEPINYDLSDNNWLVCLVRDGVFKGNGSNDKLEEILNIFKIWVEKNS